MNLLPSFAKVRKAISIFTAIVILFSSVNNVVLVLEFKLNQHEIERLYCVNKAKPQLHCNGKCHLNKQLVENNAHNEKPNPKSQLEDTYKINFFQPQIAAVTLLLTEENNPPAPVGNLVLLSRLFGKCMFQPPDNQPIV